MWLIIHLGWVSRSREPTGQSVYWDTSVKNQDAHSCWVIWVLHHSDGCARTFDISFFDGNAFPSYLDGDLLCEAAFCVGVWLRMRTFAEVKANCVFSLVLITQLINLSRLSVDLCWPLCNWVYMPLNSTSITGLEKVFLYILLISKQEDQYRFFIRKAVVVL